MSDLNVNENIRGEIERILRVSDMLITGHCNLREKYDRRALFLDCSILGLSTWITSIVFVEPKIGLTLTPFHISPEVWVGLLGTITFFLSIVQLRVDWKRRSDAHSRSAEIYSNVKSGCRRLLESRVVITRDDARELLMEYQLSAKMGSPIPEGEFLKQKSKHLRKLTISKFIDSHPGASISLVKMRLWWRSNLGAYRDHLS